MRIRTAPSSSHQERRSRQGANTASSSAGLVMNTDIPRPSGWKYGNSEIRAGTLRNR